MNKTVLSIFFATAAGCMVGGCASSPAPKTADWKMPTYWDERMAVLVPYLPEVSETPPALGDYETDDSSRFIFHHSAPPPDDEGQGDMSDEDTGGTDAGGEE